MSVIERARPHLARIALDLGLELYDLEFVGGVLRVTVEREGGVDLDAIAQVTRMVSRELDHLDLFPGAYTLEVSSPGLERNLRTPEHFRRAVGSTVSVRTHPTVDGERRAQGTLVDASDEAITLQLAGAPAAGERRLRYDDIERARTVFVWGAAPAPATHHAGVPMRKVAR